MSRLETCMRGKVVAHGMSMWVTPGMMRAMCQAHRKEGDEFEWGRELVEKSIQKMEETKREREERKKKRKRGGK